MQASQNKLYHQLAVGGKKLPTDYLLTVCKLSIEFAPSCVRRLPFFSPVINIISLSVLVS